MTPTYSHAKFEAQLMQDPFKVRMTPTYSSSKFDEPAGFYRDVR